MAAAPKFEWQQYTCAIVNTASGERHALRSLLRGLRSELGEARVIILTPEIFKDPTWLKEQIVSLTAYIPPASSPLAQPSGGPGKKRSVLLEGVDAVRGTVLVAGGDGTVSFVYSQLGEMARAAKQNRSGPSPLLPALATIPLGTGNDYSNSMGFGKGYTSNGGTTSGGKLQCSCEDVLQLERMCTAPCVAFDRWRVTCIPLVKAQVCQKTARGPSAREKKGSGNETKSVVATAMASINWQEACVVDTIEQSKEEEVNEFEEEEEAEPVQRVSEERTPARDSAAMSAEEEGSHTPHRSGSISKRSSRSRKSSGDHSNVMVSPTTTSYHLMNYCGIGFDAYVCSKFDHSRRAHPSIFSRRSINKMAYGVFSLKAAANCDTLASLIPIICVPAARDPACGAAPATTTPVARSYVGLGLPKASKALVVSNIDRYAAGCKPWEVSTSRERLKIRGVDVVDDELVRQVWKHRTTAGSPSPVLGSEGGESFSSPPSPAPTSMDHAPEQLSPASANSCAYDTRITKVFVNDGRLELQSVDGLVQFGSMQMGVGSSDKLAQAKEAFVFVLCTPQDLLCTPGTLSPYTEKKFASQRKYLLRKALPGLYVQVDGEPIPPIRVPTIIRFSKEPDEVWGRCLRPIPTSS